MRYLMTQEFIEKAIKVRALLARRARDFRLRLLEEAASAASRAPVSETMTPAEFLRRLPEGCPNEPRDQKG